MSIDIRPDLVEALNTVDGVKGSPKRPAPGRTGDAWPKWVTTERSDGVFVTTWRVMVLVPDGEDAAQEWIATHLDDLIDALSPVAFIDSIEPAAAADDSPVLLITLRE